MSHQRNQRLNEQNEKYAFKNNIETVFKYNANHT